MIERVSFNCTLSVYISNVNLRTFDSLPPLYTSFLSARRLLSDPSQMSLYPSLEDMQVHKVVTAQQNALATQLRSATQATQPRNALYPNYSPSAPPSEHLVNGDSAMAHASALYPGLSDFMGLELTQEMIALNMPEYARANQVATSASTTSGMIAPLSNQTAGLKRSQLSHAIREVIVCKGNDNKVGIRVQDINKGIFITMVCKDSPAALVG